jgi:hypothetical protein
MLSVPSENMAMLSTVGIVANLSAWMDSYLFPSRLDVQPRGDQALFVDVLEAER